MSTKYADKARSFMEKYGRQGFPKEPIDVNAVLKQLEEDLRQVNKDKPDENDLQSVGRERRAR